MTLVILDIELHQAEQSCT